MFQYEPTILLVVESTRRDSDPRRRYEALGPVAGTESSFKVSLPDPDDIEQQPIRIAIANDFPLVIDGIARALADYAEQVVVVDYDSQQGAQQHVDVVLYDCFASVTSAVALLPELLESSARLVIFSWRTDPDMVAAALRAGAAGVVCKCVGPDELVAAIQRVHRGEQVILSRRGRDQSFGRWPGDDLGVSARESELLALICQGFSNGVISEIMFLGSNTVKTYIRTLYRKIDVETRAQAVVWGMSNGFEPGQVHRSPQ